MEEHDCWKCWDFPNLFFMPRKVNVINKKYCWLYPEREKKILKKLLPNFDECKTLYTKCDFKLEQCAHEQILKIEDEFRRHQSLMLREVALQNKLIDQMWTLSQRFLLLTNSGVCVKTYPEVVSVPTEKKILCDFHIRCKALNMSNCRMAESLDYIKNCVRELNRRCLQLDMTVESTFLVGNWYLRPLSYVREIISDMYNYYYGVLSKLKCWAQLLDPGDAVAIEDYMALVKPSDDYKNYLMIGMEKCQCMRTKNPDCINQHKTC